MLELHFYDELRGVATYRFVCLRERIKTIGCGTSQLIIEMELPHSFFPKVIIGLTLAFSSPGSVYKHLMTARRNMSAYGLSNAVPAIVSTINSQVVCQDWLLVKGRKNQPHTTTIQALLFL